MSEEVEAVTETNRRTVTLIQDSFLQHGLKLNCPIQNKVNVSLLIATVQNIYIYSLIHMILRFSKFVEPVNYISGRLNYTI